MTRHHDSEDNGAYGEVRRRGKKIHWSICKVIFTLLLFCASIALMIIGFIPLLELDFELKSFGNLLFVLLHVYYMISFAKVGRDSQFIFWSSSFLLLDIATLQFYFYEDIFF